MKSNALSKALTQGAASGTYAMACPYVLSEWPHHSKDDFELYFCEDAGMLWGRFDVSVYAGSLHMPAAGVQAGREVSFVWKGSEAERGEERQGGGSVRFMKGGKKITVKGALEGMYGERLGFEGVKVDDEPTGGKTMALYMIKQDA